jgi:lipid II:glycine glycyltransferase (peptidoglycan interpeptide bridge formation enzyme)
VGDLAACDGGLQKAIKETTGLKRLYCRFRCDRERNIEDALHLAALGWKLPWSPLTTCYSMLLDLDKPEEGLLAGFDRNWRRNLRRFQEGRLKVTQWLDASADEVFAVYDSMQNAKGLEEQLSREEIEQILANLKQQLVLYRCDDEQGQVMSLLGCLVIGERACCVLSATSEAGRSLNTSYGVFWALFQHCQRIGVKSLDLAGIDPIRNHGVYRFKRATGAAPIEYLGEWDWATHPRMRWFGNWAIERRDLLKRVSSTFATTRSVAKAPVRIVASGVRAALTLLLAIGISFE